jgi:hypothetical protein
MDHIESQLRAIERIERTRLQVIEWAQRRANTVGSSVDLWRRGNEYRLINSASVNADFIEYLGSYGWSLVAVVHPERWPGTAS